MPHAAQTMVRRQRVYSSAIRIEVARIWRLDTDMIRPPADQKTGSAMPKTQIVSPKLRQPSGHFSHATVAQARGRIVFISGMTARRADGSIAGIGDIEA